MTKVENLENPLTAPFVIMWGSFSINRGEIDRKALMNSIELLKSGQLIYIAPEGHRHPEGLSQPKDGFAYIATKADTLIIPARSPARWAGWTSSNICSAPTFRSILGVRSSSRQAQTDVSRVTL